MILNLAASLCKAKFAEPKKMSYVMFKADFKEHAAHLLGPGPEKNSFINGGTPKVEICFSFLSSTTPSLKGLRVPIKLDQPTRSQRFYPDSSPSCLAEGRLCLYYPANEGLNHVLAIMSSMHLI